MRDLIETRQIKGYTWGHSTLRLPTIIFDKFTFNNFSRIALTGLEVTTE